MTTDISVKIGALELESPVIPASGVWPYAPEFWSGVKLDGVGALCTKAISLEPRRGNRGVRVWETPCGVLNSIGLQNCGVRDFVKNYGELAKNCPRPVIANVVMERPDDVRQTLRELAEVEGIAAAELNISCPNVDGEGMSWGTDCLSAAQAVRSVREVWRGPLWVKMTPQAADPASVARAIEAEGADAIVCANTWLGMAIDMNTGRPAFDRVTAGLSGPAVFPLALRVVWQVAGAVSIPVIGCGGVSSASDCAGMMLAGASAVEVGSAFFHNLSAAEAISSGLPEFVKRYGAGKLSDIVGAARRG
ncbi:MAG: dihydroorotate dehydrogenase [Cloacibacillus sp.]